MDLKKVFQNNQDWIKTKLDVDNEYFERLSQGQSPEILYIGCSDSRATAEEIMGAEPGEVFVHRNVANVVHSSVMNLLTALEFAVEALEIREIIVCGHYGCGGVRAATEDLPHGLVDHWLEPIRRLSRSYAVDLAQAPYKETYRDRLAELYVIEGVRRVSVTPILQRACKHGTEIRVHGLIYSLRDGLLRDLNCTIDESHSRLEAAE